MTTMNMLTFVYLCLYMYIYIGRERERARNKYLNGLPYQEPRMRPGYQREYTPERTLQRP